MDEENTTVTVAMTMTLKDLRELRAVFAAAGHKKLAPLIVMCDEILTNIAHLDECDECKAKFEAGGPQPPVKH